MKYEFDRFVETSSKHGKIAVDLFTDAKCMVDGNSICHVYNSIADDAFKYSWIGTSFYGNPVYNANFATKTFWKELSDSI